MKKALSLLLALLILLSAFSVMPLTASASTADNLLNKYFGAAIQKPQTPYVHCFFNDAWDEIHLYQNANNDIYKLGYDYNTNENFMDENGLAYLNIYLQVDYKIDGGAWHYTENWDTGWTDNIPNWGLHQVEQSPDVGYYASKMLSFKLSDAVAYNFDAPEENGDFQGLVSREGVYPDYTNYHFDMANHTYTYRYRYKVDATDWESYEYSQLISEWSDAVSIGKNATVPVLTKSQTPAAITIQSGSCLASGDDKQKFNNFYLDITVPQSIYNDLKYYEIIEGMFEPLVIETQYRVNGGAWKEIIIANATSISEGERAAGDILGLKKGDKVEFRMRVAEGEAKAIKGAWSKVYALQAAVTDYQYKEPAISTLAGTATQTQVDKYITGLKNDDGAKGTTFSKFPAKQKKVTKNAIAITWSKVKGASYYVVYGNKCGKTNPYKRIGKTKATTFTYKKLKAGTYYKFLVSAFDKNGKHIATSISMHIVTAGGKYCNYKSVSTKAKKDAVVFKKSGTAFNLGAKAVKENAKLKASAHRNIRYESSNKTIATVNANGKIVAKKKGSCYVFAYAQNGVFKKIKVTVKK